MKLILASAIKIAANRQRQSFDANYLRELSDSIQSKSLLHAPILRVVGEDYFLVAGECRLRAVKDIYDLGGAFRHDGEAVREGFIPYTLLDDLDPLAAEEAELEENIRRRDLTWQERALATKRLTVLRGKQAAVAGLSHPTSADIARELFPEATSTLADGELGVYQAQTRQESIVADHLDDPEVRAAKSAPEAFKILKRKEATRKNAELAESVGKVYTSEVHRVLNEDSLVWLTKCPAETFDVILTDPPYGMGADEFGDAGGAAIQQHNYLDSPENFQRIMNIFVEHSFRVTKAQAHLYCFCDIDWFMELRLKFSEAGWWVHRTPIIWNKPSGNRVPWPQHGPQRKWEMLLYAVKGKKPILKIAPDVITFPADDNLGLSAQKPVALFEDLLRRSCYPGDSILDPFCGTGTIFAAAHNLKCKATGIELDPASFGIAVKRVGELT